DPLVPLKNDGKKRTRANIAGVKNNPIKNDLLFIFRLISQRTTFIVLFIKNTLLLFVGFSCNRYEYFIDRKSTRLNSSHVSSSYAVSCLQKKKKHPAARA